MKQKAIQKTLHLLISLKIRHIKYRNNQNNQTPHQRNKLNKQNQV